MHDSGWVSTNGLLSESAFGGGGASDSPGDDRRLPCAHDALVYEWDLVSDRLAWSGDVGRVLGGIALDALKSGDGFARLIAGDSGASRFLAVLASAPDGDGLGTPYRASYRLRRRADAPIAVEDCGRMFADGRGRPLVARGLLRAVGDVVESAGAHNRSRAEFLREVDGILRSARSRSTPFALLSVALEPVRDRGICCRTSAAGDAMPRALLRGLRFGDRVAWIADGRYAFFLRADRGQATAFARRLAGLLAEDGHRPSIGAALASPEGRGAHLLLERAAAALATAAPGGAVAFHSFSRRARFRRLSIEALRDDIVRALNDRRIGLARRPSLALGAAAPLVEGLACLQCEDGRIVSPLELRLAAAGGELADLLDSRLVELALTALRGEPRLVLMIAPSTGAALSSAWLARLAAALSSSPSIAARLIVALRHFGADSFDRRWLDAARRVKRLGVGLAVDDFSAASGTLPSLRRLGVDLVKIDGALTQDLARASADRSYLRGIVDAAKRLGMATIAKGADDPETLRQLKNLGFEFAQGGAFEWPPESAQIAPAGPAQPSPLLSRRRAFADALSPYSPAYPAASAFR